MKILNVGIRVASLAALVGWSLPALAQTTLTKPEDVGLSSARLALIHDAVKIQFDAG